MHISFCFNTRWFSLKPGARRHRDEHGWFAMLGWLGFSVWLGTWQYQPDMLKSNLRISKLTDGGKWVLAAEWQHGEVAK